MVPNLKDNRDIQSDGKFGALVAWITKSKSCAILLNENMNTVSCEAEQAIETFHQKSLDNLLSLHVY